VFKGSPAPTNLTIPPHRYADAAGAVLVIGEDTQGA
jgi:Rieske Fe-S protein